MDEWLQSVRHKHKRTIARFITQVENGETERMERLKQLYPYLGHAHLIGFTGPPGSGKSTLVDSFIQHLRQQNYTVAVIAVDPTSPFTGGAILGDRVRMTRHALDEGVFIRSMGSRGSLGGLSRATKEAVHILDAAGFDVVLIETVGVGQAELDIMHIADTVALVLNPGDGDAVQVFKAGIMEIADLFIVNKADLPGTKRLVSDIEELLHLIEKAGEWLPPIVETVGNRENGIPVLWDKVQAHKRFLRQRGSWEKKRSARRGLEVKEIMEEHIQTLLQEICETPTYQAELQHMLSNQQDPHQFAQKWFKTLLKKAYESGR
ncbi:methylmalonyl Co-A mutase-associated GTPase MeaB [Hazenella sp. IB182357]|uniref:Methylmalonyl Co-A mutase-associated GTPase MeaB n=1 Tax=Polycladospora coralii TaxID=2771432 RepID=A0A926N8H0_9BACL|nr:methylmalonyl Co-A mutase-associated GTPase MeaB [Polycladospora coralii]MBD1372066.1 methylmalonyl Co-A mutase-associated GTPase MeaB [Polycladospora coralii]